MNARSPRLPAQIAGVIAAVLLAAVLLFRFAVYEPPRAAVVQPPPPVRTAVVLSVEGEVESGHDGGGWSRLQPGQKVRSDDLLRTGVHSRTALQIDPRSRVDIDESSEVAIRELTDSVHRFRLTRGRMAAEYEQEGRRLLRVEDGTGDAVAEASTARFSVLSTGTGLAVATASGQVELKARMQTVSVVAGEQSFVPRGGDPLPAAPIPAAVVLKVANALAEGTASICAQIEGTVSPGSEVRVDGVPVAVGPDGSFRYEVLRAQGREGAVVFIRDPSGREKKRTVPCSPSPAVIDDMAIRWKVNR